MAGFEGYTAVVTLLTDWNTLGYQKLKAKDLRRAKLFSRDANLHADTPENRRYIAANLGNQHLPAAVLDYQSFVSLKSKAPVLYTVTREDYLAYLQWADEEDNKHAGL